MIRIHVTNRAGQTYAAEAADGRPLMEVLRARGDVEALCGGNCVCATCHVHIDEAWRERVGEAGPDEMALLEYSMEKRPTSRLSCQVQVTQALDGLSLCVAPAEG
ncbi:MAG: 2Fe-2S iron-sulfur cluster binding domain-containing protein [Nevskia sp.]|nr:2Fe-2S iron-sulfur cluster binding domain-containing protein [Nevskia sp.]